MSSMLSISSRSTSYFKMGKSYQLSQTDTVYGKHTCACPGHHQMVSQLCSSTTRESHTCKSGKRSWSPFQRVFNRRSNAVEIRMSGNYLPTYPPRGRGGDGQGLTMRSSTSSLQGSWRVLKPHWGMWGADHNKENVL